MNGVRQHRPYVRSARMGAVQLQNTTHRVGRRQAALSVEQMDAE